MSFTSGSHTRTFRRRRRIEPDFAELFPPHRFSAASVCSDGDTVLWSGITRRRFEGYPLEAFAPLRASPDAPAGAWHASVRVEFDDGESLVRMSEGIGAPPLGVGPLLSYPSPHARRMTLALSAGGRSYRRWSTLCPMPRGAVPFMSIRRSVRSRLRLPQRLSTPERPEIRPAPSRSPDCCFCGKPSWCRRRVPRRSRAHPCDCRRARNQSGLGVRFEAFLCRRRRRSGLADSAPRQPRGIQTSRSASAVARQRRIASADDAVYALLGAPAAVPDLVRIDSGRADAYVFAASAGCRPDGRPSAAN